MRRKDLHEMARLALKIGNLDEALRYCDRALAADALDAQANFLKAVALLRLCGPGWTARVFREVLAGTEWVRLSGPGDRKDAPGAPPPSK